MNNETSKPPAISLTQLTQPIRMDSASCQLDGEGYCITCSDEALFVTVLSIDEATGVALVAVKDLRRSQLIAPTADKSASDDMRRGRLIAPTADLSASETTEEVDITLIENVAPGDTLLVHAGVAIGHAVTNLPMGDDHAVGADLSRPSPIDRP